MVSAGNLILNGTMVIATLWIVNRYLGIFGNKRSNIIAVCIWVLFGVFQAYVQINSGVASIWTTVISIGLVTSISVFGYDSGGKKSILEVLLLYVVWLLIEIIISFCINMFPLEENNSNMAGNVISKIVMIIGVYVFSVNDEYRNCGYLLCDLCGKQKEQVRNWNFSCHAAVCV